MFVSSNRWTEKQEALIVGGWEGFALQSWRLLCSRPLLVMFVSPNRWTEKRGALIVGGWEGYVLQRSVNVSLSTFPLSLSGSAWFCDQAGTLRENAS